MALELFYTNTLKYKRDSNRKSGLNTNFMDKTQTFCLDYKQKF